jgi:hypothetical protein
LQFLTLPVRFSRAGTQENPRRSLIIPTFAIRFGAVEEYISLFSSRATEGNLQPYFRSRCHATGFTRFLKRKKGKGKKNVVETFTNWLVHDCAVSICRGPLRAFENIWQQRVMSPGRLTG